MLTSMVFLDDDAVLQAGPRHLRASNVGVGGRRLWLGLCCVVKLLLLRGVVRRPPCGVQGVLNALSDSCQFLSDSKSLLWPPPCPPTLPKICVHSPGGRPKPPTLSILSRLFAVRKLIKNQTPQNSSQNLKSRTPDRPNLDFGLTFGIHFGMEFS